jgi:hypothetical protein
MTHRTKFSFPCGSHKTIEGCDQCMIRHIADGFIVSCRVSENRQEPGALPPAEENLQERPYVS